MALSRDFLAQLAGHLADLVELHRDDDDDVQFDDPVDSITRTVVATDAPAGGLRIHLRSGKVVSLLLTEDVA